MCHVGGTVSRDAWTHLAGAGVAQYQLVHTGNHATEKRNLNPLEYV
jgi:hypothetical protein